MQKLLSLLLIGIFVLSLAAQEQWSPELKKMEQRLREVYGQIYDLKQQAQDNSSPELLAKIRQLTQEAKALENDIQRWQEKAPPVVMEPKPPIGNNPEDNQLIKIKPVPKKRHTKKKQKFR